MDNDVVEALLESLNLRTAIFSRMESSGAWGFSKPPLEGAPFYLVTSGEFWVNLPGEAVLVRCSEGDLIILPRGGKHEIRGVKSAAIVPFKPVLSKLGWAAWIPGTRYKAGVLKYGKGQLETTLIAGVFGYKDRREPPLLRELPEIFHLKHADQSLPLGSWYVATTRLLRAEMDSGGVGSGAIAARLAELIFVQAIRFHLQTDTANDRGWLRGIADCPVRAPSAVQGSYASPFFAHSSFPFTTILVRARRIRRRNRERRRKSSSSPRNRGRVPNDD